jgi:hypothetical protein
MKIDFKKIINIKNVSDLKDYLLDTPIFHSNYLFHYLILINNLDGLKLQKFPIYIENSDGLNGFHLAAKEGNINILSYLIETYPEYIYNKNNDNMFTYYLPGEYFSVLMNKYPKLNWIELINLQTLKYILTTLSYNELINFFKVYDIKPKNGNQYLFSVLENNLLTDDQKTKLLNNFTDDEINAKTEFGVGLITYVLYINNKILFDYLINRDIDLDYMISSPTNTINSSHNPLKSGIYNDIINDKYYYSKIIISKIKDTNKEFYNDTDGYIDNIAHVLLYYYKNVYIPILQNKKVKKDSNEIIKIYTTIFSYCDNNTWNQHNCDKITPLELLVNLDYDIYSKIIINNNISINPDIFLDLKKNNLLKENTTENINKWIKLYKSQPVYKHEENNVIIKFEPYSHYTMFQAKLFDVCIYFIYLKETYSQLLVPSMKSYILDGQYSHFTFPLDVFLIEKPFFPWSIAYYTEDKYYIHPYLNNLINAERRNNNKRFAILFLSIIYQDSLHANIIIYDFKNMTIERFEPYGGHIKFGNTQDIDKVLDEELTWNTGFKYLKPSDYLPNMGFQILSHEQYIYNKKTGDPDGFCLAWCLWYIETKIKNQNINSKELVLKVINKIKNSEIKFNEYIRNYSNKINNIRLDYLKKMKIDDKDSSNTNVSFENNKIIYNYIINSYNKDSHK